MPDTLIAVIMAGCFGQRSGAGGVVKIPIPGTMAPGFAAWKPAN